MIIINYLIIYKQEQLSKKDLHLEMNIIKLIKTKSDQLLITIIRDLLMNKMIIFFDKI